MQKFALSLGLAALLLLAGCGSDNQQAENAGKAMAEMTCLVSNDVPFDQITQQAGEIMKNYGWEKAEDVDLYLNSIQDPSELEIVKTAIVEQLDQSCGAKLREAGLDTKSVADSLVKRD